MRLILNVVLAAATACSVAGVATSATAQPAASAQQTVTVTDLRQRTVSLKVPARRLLIDDGRFLTALALIHRDPVSVLAGWPRDINRLGDATYQKLLTLNPALAKVPQAASSAGTFSVEQALAVNPDVAVFSTGAGPTDAQLAQLTAAGIPVVFIDFFTQPLEHLAPSLTLLGRIVGRQAEAAKFLAFRQQRLDRIAAGLKAAKAPTRPNVFLEAHAGISPECCNSPGKGNIGDYIELVGGHNIGADVLPGASGRLNLEFVVAKNPDVYVLTGGPHLEKPGGFVIGPGYTPERSRISLDRMARRTGLATLPVLKTGRVHGLSHQLLNSPLDIVTVEVLARWIHPELFAALAPEQTLAEMNRTFLAVPVEGPLWLDLRGR